MIIPQLQIVETDEFGAFTTRPRNGAKQWADGYFSKSDCLKNNSIGRNVYIRFLVLNISYVI